MLDRHARRRVRNALAGRLGPWAVRVWAFTVRPRFLGPIRREGRRPLPPEPGVYPIWHRELLLPAYTFRGTELRVLISAHADGEMIARIIEGLGMRAVRGSTTRGGAKAVRAILRDRGDDDRLFIMLTPDGPRGPAEHVQSGAVWLASRLGLPLWPSAVCLRRPWRLPTWDGFHLPRPFDRALFRVRERFRVPADADRSSIEAYRERIEEAVRSLHRDTEERFDELWREARPLRSLPVWGAPIGEGAGDATGDASGTAASPEPAGGP